MKTIAELEAAYDAARAAELAAINAREAMKDLLAATLAFDNAGENDCLPAEVRAMAAISTYDLIEELRKRIDAAKVEIERLEDVRGDAARALNDAPEEAA